MKYMYIFLLMSSSIKLVQNKWWVFALIMVFIILICFEFIVHEQYFFSPKIINENEWVPKIEKKKNHLKNLSLKCFREMSGSRLGA